MKILKKAFWTLIVILALIAIFLVAKGIIWISSAVIKVSVIVVLALIAVVILYFVWRKGSNED